MLCHSHSQYSNPTVLTPAFYDSVDQGAANAAGTVADAIPANATADAVAATTHANVTAAVTAAVTTAGVIVATIVKIVKMTAATSAAKRKMTAGKMTAGKMTAGKMTAGKMTAGKMTAGKTTAPPQLMRRNPTEMPGMAAMMIGMMMPGETERRSKAEA